jgi:3,4-dihydroxy 2-butanone 4-phosphate synthase
MAITIPVPRPWDLPPVALRRAVESLRAGRPVLVYDDPGREGETDMVLLAERATPETLRQLRQEAGGLLCVAVPEEFRRRVGLPFADELLRHGSQTWPVLSRIVPDSFRYDRRSSFGITVNHRSTFTGIPDRDRALTARALGEVVRDAPGLRTPELQSRFTREFLSPGHVPLLYAASGLLRERRGHTELTVALAEMGGVTPALIVCEMLGDDGGALPRDRAREKAGENGWEFLDGSTIVEAWSAWSG